MRRVFGKVSLLQQSVHRFWCPNGVHRKRNLEETDGFLSDQRLEKTKARGQVVDKVRKAPDPHKSFGPKHDRGKTL